MNSKQKGKRGELEVKDLLIKFGYEARRGVQFSGSQDSPDVVSDLPGIHIEAKWVESLNLYSAFKQSERDADGKIPTVWHRRSRTPWMITMRAEDFLEIFRKHEKKP